MNCSDIDATIIEEATKSALMGLGKLGTTVNVDSEAIEMNILAQSNADHHPTEGFEVMEIAKAAYHIDAVSCSLHHKAGKYRGHCFCRLALVTYQLKLASASFLVFVSVAQSFVSQAAVYSNS